MPQIHQAAVRNRLLAALAPDAFDQLAASLHPVSLELRQTLYTPGQPIPAVYFIESGMVSVLAPLEGGELLEVGLIGREGLVGLPVILDVDTAPTETLVQAPGAALRLSAAALRQALERSPGLQNRLLRYMQAFHIQVAQTAACNGHHSLEERFVRWLLMAHDRADGDTFAMTHEFIAMMLGVRRAGVTIAAGTFQKAGLIRYAQGNITILDRPGLEEAACACYRTVQQQFEHILGG